MSGLVMLNSKDLGRFCRRNLINWVFIPPMTRAAWLRTHLETSGLEELCYEFGRYQKIRPRDLAIREIVEVESVGNVDDVNDWLNFRYQNFIEQPEWDEVELFLDNGGFVQCVSILVTLPHDRAVMEGYLKFSYPKTGNSKFLLGSTGEYMAIYPDAKQLKNILQNPYQLGRAAQIPLGF
jgi:hypothetical protein